MASNPLPLYHKVYLLLRQRLESGQFAPDEPMPGEHALAEQYGVSRLTIRRSLETLANEGLVMRRQGSGTFPSPSAVLSHPQHASDIDSLLSHLSSMGEHTDVSVLEFGYEAAHPDVARRLELEPHSRVQKSVRIRRHEGHPFSHLTTYVPEAIGSRFQESDLTAQPLLEIFRRMGIEIGGADEAITAILADLHTSGPLDVPIGSPLLSLRRLLRDRAGRPIEYLIAAYRPDRYEYRTTTDAASRAAGLPDPGKRGSR
ncbi:putative HTH-type transcriptional regulator YidP [compost metagenome]|uniref:GntR family transcriptional regulator n=1 Tax=Achromobacter sp. Root83 TaxID=1736602 RepID=UPI000B1527AE|nr:GntR family transcriptional regulator [Achromobacter sp. Root83]